jgi:uncharacterized HAD superfamily protein
MKVRKKKAIVCDIDDTIVDFLGQLCYDYNKINGTCITCNDLTSWDFDNISFKDVRGNEVNGKDLIALMRRSEKAGLYSRVDILRDADYALEIMKGLGYEIILMTARPETFGEETYFYLLKHGIVYDELIFTQDKAASINNLRDKYHFTMFVDDSAKHLENVDSNCYVENICCIERGHNKNIELDKSIIRVKSLFECIRYLKKTK